jgi:serine/threonine protein phosphatase 1
MRTLAIGDIHGSYTALTTLLEKLRPLPDDRIVFLGDYIDRGPGSRQVIDTLLELRKSCLPIFVRGNHEVMILQSRTDPVQSNLWQSYGGLETLHSYGAQNRDDWASRIPDAHWEFFERTVSFFETDTHIFVHACLDAKLDMNDQPESILCWEYFEDMKPHKSGKRVVCGHTPQLRGKIKDVGFAVCIDTAAATGGWLTCLDVNSGKYWQANEHGQTRDGELS